MPSPPDFAAQCALAKGEDGPRINVLRLVHAALLAADEPISSGEIARKIGANIKSVQSAILRLSKEGKLIKHGTADCNTRWSLTNRKRAKPLPERRGKSPGSRAALKHFGGNSGFGPRNYRNLKNVKLTSDGKLIPRPKPTTALEQAWGFVPASPSFRSVDDDAM